MRDWPILDAALKVADKIAPTSDQKLPHEVLRLDAETAAIVFDIDGVDYIATLIKLPLQRNRPPSQ